MKLWMKKNCWDESKDALDMILISERKLRLFATACSNYLTSPKIIITKEHLNWVSSWNKCVYGKEGENIKNNNLYELVARWCSMPFYSQELYDDKLENGVPVQCHLLRDIVIPFPQSFHSSWFTWNDGTIPRLAQTAYDDKLGNGQLDNSRFAVLADALEDAGCEDSRILNHCRQEFHVRGCWVLDMLLGKE